MPPLQLGIPEQLTLQVAPLQPTRILQEPLPVQLTFVVFAAVLETVEAHALGPAQFTMHESPVHEIGFAHVSVSVHWMSHAGAVQMTAPVQLPAPTHLTLHASPAQRMVLVQEPAPTQLIAHELALWQSICPVHVPAPVQVTTQGMPSGQTMGFVHVPSTPQVTLQVPASSHVPTPASAQSAGHTAAASMRGAASASFVPASPGGGAPSLVTITSSPSRASVSLVLPSSAPNITSGKVQAAPASVLRLANARATMSLFFMGRVSRESRSLEDRPTHEDAHARPPPRGRHHRKIAAVRSRPPARRRSPRTIVDHRERCGFKLSTTMRVAIAIAIAIVRAGAVGGVIGARLHHAAREAPGRVTMKGPTLQLTLGERAGGASARLDRLAEILRGAAITNVVRSDIAVALWSKLLFVEPFGSVGAVTRASIDVVRALPETRALLVQAMKELQAVAVGTSTRICIWYGHREQLLNASPCVSAPQGDAAFGGSLTAVDLEGDGIDELLATAKAGDVEGVRVIRIANDTATTATIGQPGLGVRLTTIWPGRPRARPAGPPSPRRRLRPRHSRIASPGSLHRPRPA